MEECILPQKSKKEKKRKNEVKLLAVVNALCSLSALALLVE